jgi:hypothetical protein
LGEKVARQLMARLADLKAAGSAADLVVGRPRRIHRDGAEQIIIALGEEHSLTFKSNHSTVPTKGAGGTVDWRAVKRIKITSIEAQV